MRGPVHLVFAWLLASPALAGGAASEPVGEGASPKPESGECAAAIGLRVQGHYEGVRDLEARFVQRTRSVVFGSAGGASQEARGVLVFAKPGRMRWSYEAPEPSLVVSDGETLWIHDPVAREVQVLKVGQGFLSGTALQFLLGEGELAASFHLEAERCEPDESGAVSLVLRPREEASYERLELRVDAESGAVRESTVIDLFGNRTEVALAQVRTNSDPPAERFRFEVPPDVRVLTLDGTAEPAP